MQNIGRGGKEVHVEIGRDEEHPIEEAILEANAEEAKIDALGLLGAYQDDDDEGDD